MGLDWIAFHLMADGEEFNIGSYRGKGVAYDKNIEEQHGEVRNDCYGDPENVKTIKDDDGDDITRDNIMTEEQRDNITAALEELLEADKDTIKHEENDSYEEWREWMQGALDFLEGVDYDEGQYIWCWF